jgi:hypothetical protein
MTPTPDALRALVAELRAKWPGQFAVDIVIREAADRLESLIGAGGWRPIAEADSATAYLLFIPSFGVHTGMRYDGGWVVFQHDGELARCATPSHFREIPPPPTGDA